MGSSQWSMGCNLKDFYNTYLPPKINSYHHPTPFPVYLEFHWSLRVMSPAGSIISDLPSAER